MKLHLLNSFFLALFLIIGCNNSSEGQNQNNFKKYFFQPDWFKETKVYEYEVKVGNNKHYIYKQFEKTGNNLKMTIYDKDLNKSAIVIYEYFPNKVLINETYTIENWNNDVVSKELIKDSTVFEYHRMNKEFGFSNTSRIEGESDVSEFVTRTLKRIGEFNFQGKKVNAVFATGQTKVVIKNSEKSPGDIVITNFENLVYAENIGVIQIESKNQYVEAIINLTRIISLNEFEKLNNAH